MESLKLISYNDLNRENKQLLNQTNEYFKSIQNFQVSDILSNIIYDGNSIDAETCFEKFLLKENQLVLLSLQKCDFKTCFVEA